MSHDHCDCVEGLEEHIAWQRDQLAEQDARGLRLAGELEHAEAEVERLQEELAGWMNEDTHEGHALRGKVERLREDLRLQKAEQVEWAADNERLGEWKARRQAGQESIDISLLRAEVEQALGVINWLQEYARNALAEEKE